MNKKVLFLSISFAISSTYGSLGNFNVNSGNSDVPAQAVSSSDSSEVRASIGQQKITSADFAGHWRGDENCNTISTPDAVLTIKQAGTEEVIIMGIYASNGGIKGSIVGNTVVIPYQVVPDFDFRISVEGTLVISSDHKLLNSNITVINNGLKDICANSYNR